MRIYTSRYQNKSLVLWPGVKVGITHGRPRFTLGYSFHWLKLFAPDLTMLQIKDQVEFSRLYGEKLDRIGIDTIMARLHQVSNGKDICLLCFEDLRKPGEWCHRQVLALWMGKHGVEVEELPELELAVEKQGTAITSGKPIQLNFEEWGL